jgi:hypothetical protein
MLPCYAVSDSAADKIVDIAATVGAFYLILGAPERNMLVNVLRGEHYPERFKHLARRDSSPGLCLKARWRIRFERQSITDIRSIL